jgi:hypothetical protein
MKKIYESIKDIISEADSKAPKYTTQQYVDWAKKYADEHGVPHSVVLHSMFKETGRSGDPEKMRAARNTRSGASGVMQIMPQYAPHAPYKVDTKDLFDPEKNIAAGVRGLAYYYKQHRNPKLKDGATDVNAAMKALASYNAGENYVQKKDKYGKVYYVGAGKYIKTGNPKDLPRKETRDYIADFKDDPEHYVSVMSKAQPVPMANKIESGKTHTKPLYPERTTSQSNNVQAPVVQDKPAPIVPKKDVRVANQPPAAPEVKAQVAAPENPYPKGSKLWYFKDARNRGLKSYTDPDTGKEIAVKLKDTQESVQLTGEAKVEPNMKRIYESTKQILREKTEAPSWGANLMKVFKGETLTSSGREANLQKQANAEREAEIAQVNAQAAARAKAEQDRKAAEAAKQKVNQAAIAALSPKKDERIDQASARVGLKKSEKQAAPKKELSPFEQEFAAARSKGKKEFTWYDKQGRPYQVATKLKGEEEPPAVKAVTSVKTTRTLSGEIKRSGTKTRSAGVSDAEMADIDTQLDNQKKNTSLQSEPKSDSRKNIKFDMEKERERVAKDISNIDIKPAEKTDDEKKSDELWGDIRKDLENETPEDKKARDERIKQYKKEWGWKDQTNEGKQMSINKKFNVSDALYQSVMEVMKKPSAGSAPKSEKEKDLAAMTPPGHLITHGDVLKARGVTMKEAKKLDPVGEEDEDVDNDGKVSNSDSYLKNRRKAIGAAIKEDGSDVTKKILDGIEALAGSLGLQTNPSSDQAKKDEKKGVDQANQGKASQKPAQPKKPVKEDWVDSKGKFHKEAPPPGQVPSPSEMPPGGYPTTTEKKSTKKPQPGSTTKAMDVEEQIVQEMSSKQKMKLGLYNKKKSAVKENTDTPGNSYEHQCAIHVKSESFGEGRTITTQHADVDENGHIAWYDVMFEHGIERYVPTNELEILVSESHMHSMKKKKKVTEAVRGYVDSTTGARPPANQAERDTLAKEIKTNRDINRSDTSTTGYSNRVTPQRGVDSAGTGGARGPVVTTGDFDRATPPLGTRVDPKATGEYRSQLKIPAGSGKMGGGGGGGGGMMDPGAFKNFRKMY